MSTDEVIRTQLYILNSYVTNACMSNHVFHMWQLLEILYIPGFYLDWQVFLHSFFGIYYHKWSSDTNWQAGVEYKTNSVDRLNLIPGCSWRLYEHINYRGVSTVLRPGYYRSWRRFPRGNDKLSSLNPASKLIRLGRKYLLSYIQTFWHANHYMYTIKLSIITNMLPYD